MLREISIKMKQNYQERNIEYRKAKSLLFNHYSEGCIKITEKESLLHATTKLQVAYYFKCQGYEVYSEANFYNAGRCDLICINRRGYFYIVEIVNSESKKSIEEKRKSYPSEFIVVDAKTFKFEEFKI